MQNIPEFHEVNYVKETEEKLFLPSLLLAPRFLDDLLTGSSAK